MEIVDARRWFREKQAGGWPFDHGGVVAVGGQDAGRTGLGAAADHLEQGLGLWLSIDDEVGVENLVPAVLAVGLREHHQLDVRRIPAEGAEVLDQVVDFVRRQGQAHGGVGGFNRRAAKAENIHRR